MRPSRHSSFVAAPGLSSRLLRFRGCGTGSRQTIFLPLSFITGFFGQNFGFLVTDLIRAPWTFWVLGVGSMLATCLGLLLFFRGKGWV